MRKRLSFIPVGTIVALALLPAGALATAGGSAGVPEPTGSPIASGAFSADGFLSPDKKVWCSGDSREVGCVAFRGAVSGPGHGAIVKRGGRVVLCAEKAGRTEWDCFQNFDEKAPVLRYGQRAEVGGFRCASARDGITCTVAATGKGFVINRDEVLRVG
jgi:hypothetical protein